MGDTYYYSELADPPATRVFRHALAAVGDYTILLVLLAENRNLDEAKAQIQVLAGNLGGALASSGRYVEALREFRRATQLNPQYGPALESIQRLERMGIR